jgi:hypothetical protein
MLREEIMNSLSPRPPSSDFLSVDGASTAAYHEAAGPVRESSYLPDLYGDYWAATEAKPDLSHPQSLRMNELERPGSSSSLLLENSKEDRAATPTNMPDREIASGFDQSQTAADSEELRRRFSWEVGRAGAKGTGAGLPPSEPQVEQKNLDSEIDNVMVADPLPVSAPTETSAGQGATDASHSSLSPKADFAFVSGQAPSGEISHQMSKASTLPLRSQLDAPVELPSPVSVLSDKRRLSLAEEKTLIQTSTSPLYLPTPPGQHPAAVVQELQQQQQESLNALTPPSKQELVSIMPFRQIMELPSALERIKHYNQTRSQFAAIDTGLDEWLLALKSQHPEHANASFSFKEGLPGPGASLEAQHGLALGQGNTSAPYLQHSNASSPGFSQGGKPTSNIPMPPHGTTGFGHSSNQVGTKSKELLMAASKAGKGFGKGLLSKGKNKLRGTGDKVFFNS